MARRVLTLTIVFLCMCLLLTPAFSAEAEEESGAGFPDFNLDNMNGDNVSDEEAFGDADLILIDFFTYYCKPCKKFWPYIDEYYQEYEEYGFKAILFDEDEPEGIPLTTSYMKQKGYTFEVLFDTDGEIESFYSVDKHPTAILLDGDGNIVYRHEGYNKGDEETIEEKIVEYLVSIGNMEE
jgi:cytochrome c biogenesis protein CcmG/thiol:disulfide interchange protein DsbE